MLQKLKNQFWKPTLKLLPREFGEYWFIRIINNYIFWLTLIFLLIFWLASLEEFSKIISEKGYNYTTDVLFNGELTNFKATTQGTLVISFLLIITASLKFTLFVVYKIYYLIKPIGIDQIKNHSKDIQKTIDQLGSLKK